MSTYDYSDPGTDQSYCDRLGGHPGVERTCAECGTSVYVSRHEPYQVRVVCQRCDDKPVIQQQRGAA